MNKLLTVKFLLFFIIIIPCFALAYEGIILNEPMPGSCSLLRGNKAFKCGTGTRLYFGDTVQIGFPDKELNLHLFPHAQLLKDELGLLHIEKATHKVEEGWIKALIENHLGKEQSYLANTAVRGGTDHTIKAFIEAIKVTPPPEATILPSIPISFRWRKNEVDALVIEDKSGKIVFLHELGESDFYELNPKKAGLKEGDSYTWYYRGDLLEDRFRLNILRANTKLTRKINEELKPRAEIKTIDEAIYASAYLQVISDIDDSLDFYWLSYQVLLRPFESISESQEIKVLNLMNRYYEKTKMMN